MNKDPRWFGLPHSEFRPSQFDAIEKIIKMHQSGGGVIFVDSPVGTGKSGIGCALGAIDKVTVMTSTLQLIEQYETQYGFTAIRGRQFYECVYPKKLQSWQKPEPPTAFDCHFNRMQECPAASQCPYLKAKISALVAQRSVMSYKYGALSSSMARRSGFLVFDECDVSAREIISHAEMLITGDECNQWQFPEIPTIKTGVLTAKAELIDWLWKCDLALPQPNPSNVFEMALAGEVEKKRKKISRTIETVEMGDWFVNSNDGNLLLKPLTASYLAQNAYSNKKTIVLMSATIGNPEALAKQLGIADYEHVEYPHPTPVEYRPVYAMRNAPRMSYTPSGMDDKKYTIQGIMLWQTIQTLDPSWRGIALTSSAAKANKLHAILQERFTGRNVMTGKSNDLVYQFKKDKRPGTIAVGYIQGWSHGVDLFGDIGRFSAICSVPFPSDLDPYIPALRLYDKAFYEYGVYSAIIQGVGRVTRGEKDKNGQWIENVGILADRRIWDERAMKYYSNWFIESIVMK